MLSLSLSLSHARALSLSRALAVSRCRSLSRSLDHLLCLSVYLSLCLSVSLSSPRFSVARVLPHLFFSRALFLRALFAGARVHRAGEGYVCGHAQEVCAVALQPECSVILTSFLTNEVVLHAQ